jgi:hypothetical protein
MVAAIVTLVLFVVSNLRRPHPEKALKSFQPYAYSDEANFLLRSSGLSTSVVMHPR